MLDIVPEDEYVALTSDVERDIGREDGFAMFVLELDREFDVEFDVEFVIEL